MANLEDNVGKITLVATGDGKIIVGTLKGFDQSVNLVLEDAHERIFSHTQGVEQVPLGLYLIRGDNVACVGEVDQEIDGNLGLGGIRAEPLQPIVH